MPRYGYGVDCGCSPSLALGPSFANSSKEAQVPAKDCLFIAVSPDQCNQASE